MAGLTIFTADGLNALANASATGGSVAPKYFKYTSQSLLLDPTLTASDIVGWHTQDISVCKVFKEGDSTFVEFVCDVTPTDATDYMRFCGLYLEDGTLFAVAKPPFPLPPELRQTFIIQLTYQNIDSLMNFQYLNFDEGEQDLNALSFAATQAELLMKNTLNIAGIKIEGVN